MKDEVHVVAFENRPTYFAQDESWCAVRSHFDEVDDAVSFLGNCLLFDADVRIVGVVAIFGV
jgi:hypothetical protein